MMYLQVQVREKRRMYRTGFHVRGKRRMDRTGLCQREEKDGHGRFRVVRREECIGQVEIKEKKWVYRTGSGQREEKDD